MWLFAAITVLSAATIGYEILLMRLLSIIQWHHFAYMIISLALLGYGVSGTFLALAQHWLLPRFPTAFMSSAVLFGLSAVGSFALAQSVPFNALEVLWEVRQWGYLLLLYLLLCIPFFCAATCIGLALARRQEHIGRLYQADLLGAGSGALGTVLVLFVLSPTACLTLLGSLGFLAATLVSLERPCCWWRTAALLGVGLVLPSLWPQSWIALRMSEYKGLQQTLRMPATAVLGERSGPLGWLTVVRSPRIPLRYTPDLSLNYDGALPAQLGLFTDGDGMSVITQYDGQRTALAYLDYLPSALPYHLLARPRVLILGAGGGMDVLQARYHQARAIDAVELNPQVIDLVQGEHAAFAGYLYNAPEVRVHSAEARGFVSSSREPYELIQVALLDAFSASAAGVHALNESYLYTVEALHAYLRHLRPGGLLAITRWLTVPPRDSLMLFATALQALEKSGARQPARQVAMIRGWQTVTLVVKHGELTAEDVTTLRTFCDRRSFDIAYYPGMPAALANRYHVLEAPDVFAGAIALTSDKRAEFLQRYKYDITPATDDRPYFFHFFKWRVLPEILALRGQGSLPLLEWGYLLLIAALLQATVVSVVLILVPLRRLRQRGAAWRSRHRMGVYFAALGFAFLLMEIAFMQRFILFLSHPLYAIAVVLSGFLFFAGLGSGYAARVIQHTPADASAGRPIALAVLGIVLITLLYLVLLQPLFQWCLWWPDGLKVAMTLLLIAPLAFCMGQPFPLGLAQVSRQMPPLIPWLWGVNGCTSVLSAILATILAIHYGFTVVTGLALILYGLAVVMVRSSHTS